MKYGIRSVSMDDIATALGISKKTIYQFYSDKDELVSAVVEEILGKNQGSCQQYLQHSENAIDEVWKARELMRETFVNMNASVLFDMQKYHPKAFARFQKHKNDFLHTVVKNNLERGIAEELYRAEINIDILTRFRLESMFLPFDPDFSSKIKYSLLEVEEQLMEHFLFGIATLKGHKLLLKYKQESEKKRQQI